MMPLSILVCTRDRRKMLDLILSDLSSQKYDGEVEIIVVEETDSPRSPEDVRYVPHPMRNKGIAFARNLAIEHANHELLVFVDDDCRVEATWLSQLVDAFKDSSVVGVQGGVTVPEGTNAMGWAETLLGFPGGGITRIHDANGEVRDTIEVSTLNAAYRKQVVLRAGGFPAAARFGGEDYILAKRASEYGRLLFVPEAKVQHQARGSVAAIWHWFIRRGQAEVEMVLTGSVDLTPMQYFYYAMRSSFLVKLVLCALLAYFIWWLPGLCIALWVTATYWHFRWAWQDSRIPGAGFVMVPWVKSVMGIALDVGRIMAKWGR
ncbi:MAG: glycosyltransferase [Mariprofundaceae bacterium]